MFMHFKLLYSLIFFTISVPIYICVNYIQNWLDKSVGNPIILLDNLIPFLPYTIWIYVSLFVVLLPTPLFVFPNNKKGKKLLFKLLIILLLDIITSSMMHLLFPVKVTLRNNINYENDLFIWTKKCCILLFNLDSPYSSWPSLHVSQTIIIYNYINKFNKSILIKLLVILIILSTLTMKQHYLWDVITGIIKAYVLISLF